MTVKSKIILIAMVSLLLITTPAFFVTAQYTTQQTTNVVIPSNGIFSANQTNIGVDYTIIGSPGATGTVTSSIYTGNPQPTATIPTGVSLTYFIDISFNMNATDFQNATVTINYTDSEVSGIHSPYSIYKYFPDSNTYLPLTSTVNVNTKTITVSFTSLSDPILAIGGPTGKTSTTTLPTTTWIIVAVSVIIVVIAVALIIISLGRSRKPVVRPYYKNTSSNN